VIPLCPWQPTSGALAQFEAWLGIPPDGFGLCAGNRAATLQSCSHQEVLQHFWDKLIYLAGDYLPAR
jgi:hypothetical protein